MPKNLSYSIRFPGRLGACGDLANKTSNGTGNETTNGTSNGTKKGTSNETTNGTINGTNNGTSNEIINETCTWQTHRLFPKDLFEDRSYSPIGARPSYLLELFLIFQLRIYQRFLMSHKQDFYGIHGQLLPYPPHVESDLLVRIPYLIPIVLLLCFKLAFVNSVRNVVNEKGKQLNEAMKIMGLSNWMHYFCWFIRALTMLLIPIAIITIALLVSFAHLFQT